MRNRRDLEKMTVAPRGSRVFGRSLDPESKFRLGYRLDVPEYVRPMVRVIKTATGTDEQGLEEFVVHNDSSVPAVVTFFEFEE